MKQHKNPARRDRRELVRAIGRRQATKMIKAQRRAIRGAV